MRRVAVTGMGVVSPLGSTLETFWGNLTKGVCGVGPITRYDCTEEKTKVAAEVKGFDPTLYFSKSELRKTDLFTQYAMGASVQAMEDSGLAGKIDPQRLGVYMGSGIGGITTIVSECLKMFEKGTTRHTTPHLIPMMIGNIATGNIAIRFDAQGPSLPIVTACATSTNAVGEAYRAIAHGYADAIIAGGSEAAIARIALAGFANCMALTTNPDPATACRPFDKNRDGFVMGEGAAALILEEYSHAVSRGATIYGEVCGYGNTNDAHHVTAPHPQADGAVRAIHQAMEEAGLTGQEKLYINAHGTSTPLNDRVETLAYKKVFGERAYEIPISSTKSMTGHMLGATGAIEAIASLMALHTGLIPPTISLNEPDEECDLDYVPNVAREQAVEASLSTSLGFGGHSACLAFRKHR